MTAGELAARLDGELIGSAGVVLRAVNALHDAGPADVSFVSSKRYFRALVQSRAGAVVIDRALRDDLPPDETRPVIVVDQSQLAIAAVLEMFQPPPVLPDQGVHPTAFVHPDAIIAADVRVGPHVSVDRGASIGAGSVLHAGVRVYSDTVIGKACVLHANCVVRERCQIGDRVVLHQGVMIGADGFGYRPAADKSRLTKMPHVGNVIIEDDVEIGAGTSVDRGKFGATRVGRGTKIDNLVQIAHNCVIGQNCVIAAQAGLAGSVRVGDWVQIGAQVGIADGLTIGDGARLGAKSGHMNDVPAGATMLGVPAESASTTLRQWAAIRKLPDLIRRSSPSQRVRGES